MPIADLSKLNAQRLVAASPARPRDSARLMALNRKTSAIEHRRVRDLPEYLSPKDCLVVNDSKVFPARLSGKKPTGGKCDVLLVRPEAGQGRWLALLSECRPGMKIEFSDGALAQAVRKTGQGEWLLEFSGADPLSYALKFGVPPLPHYIEKARKLAGLSLRDEKDSEDYQTVYAGETGSIAAPTAGLHFTPSLLKTLGERGGSVVKITLHVGWGTFRPVKDAATHKMLPELAVIKPEEAARINEARQNGGRICAVGTTSVRTLETFSGPDGTVSAGSGWTDIFISPPYRFKAVDALMTNFHLPGSTPLFMAAAFAGEEFLCRAYRQAVEEGYRFYSYGDAMLIL